MRHQRADAVDRRQSLSNRPTAYHLLDPNKWDVNIKIRTRSAESLIQENLPSLRRLCHKSNHGSTSSPRTDYVTSEVNYSAVRPEPIEGRAANYDTVSQWEGMKDNSHTSFSGLTNIVVVVQFKLKGKS